MNSLLTELVSLIAGLLTGFFFERRATNGVRQYNEELERQVSVLKTSIMSLGGESDHAPADARSASDLASLMTKRAIATQDPAGRVDRHALRAHFVEREYAAHDVDAVLMSLCQTGVAEEDGPWLQMT